MGWLKGAIAAVVVVVGGTAAAGWIYYRPVFAPFQLSLTDVPSNEGGKNQRVLYACNPDRAGIIILPGAIPEAKAVISREITDPQQRQFILQLFQETEKATGVGIGTSVGPVWLKQQETTISRVVGDVVRQELSANLAPNNPIASAFGMADALVQPLIDQVTAQVVNDTSGILQRNIDRACGS
ncbi:hypothetical protein VZG28_10465 [Synechococcus elongatus IITB4]|uniref:hypothetical protein n=1 Tax=Synechococcus elongatus TaxID=32046 RepID=UPI0030D0856E